MPDKLKWIIRLFDDDIVNIVRVLRLLLCGLLLLSPLPELREDIAYYALVVIYVSAGVCPLLSLPWRKAANWVCITLCGLEVMFAPSAYTKTLFMVVGITSLQLYFLAVYAGLTQALPKKKVEYEKEKETE